MAKANILINPRQERVGFADIGGNGNYYRAIDHDSLVVDTQTGFFYWNSKGIFGKPLDYLTNAHLLE